MSTNQIVSGEYNIELGAGNLNVAGNIVSTGFIQAAYYVGDGQFLNNVTANVGAASILQNGTSNVSIPDISGNITFAVNSVPNIVTVTSSLSSDSKTTGALQVAGGLGVQGNVYANLLFANDVQVLTANSVISGGSY